VVGAGVGATVFPALSCVRQGANLDPTLVQTLSTAPLSSVEPHPAFADAGRPLTSQIAASSYNNFYEFGGSKQIWRAAQALPTKHWQVEISGLVHRPRIYDLTDLTRAFPLEERIYRFRCVEAWAMVIPWIGFPMQALLKAVEPTSQAKFVRFTSFYDPEICPGPNLWTGTQLPWPYTEGLRIEEMANELAFFAVGIYGQLLPKQHGAPLRMVLPWKYGFKGAKSIVKIDFLAQQPITFWHGLSPNEYGFEANVNPNVPHPRWSQAQEQLIGTGPHPYLWQQQPTRLYNGYEEYVGDLYR
jgi:sulfoxide reductase catalytic subunit YedY